MRLAFAVVPFAFVAFLVGCSSTSTGTGASSGGGGAHGSPIDATTFCQKAVNECKQPITQQQCEQSFGVLLVSDDCKAKVSAAACTDFADNGPVDEACFPDCTTPGTQTCNGDGTITICSSQSRTLVADCAATCKSVSKTYSGTCGKSFGAQTAETDKCWCQ